MSEYLLHNNIWIALSDWNTGSLVEGLAMTIDVIVCVTQTVLSTC